MNRHQRRALAATADRKGTRLTTPVNGLSHDAVSLPAWSRLVSMLESEFGNKLHADHKTALAALVSAMTEMAQGRLQGRYAFGLPTGTGKTTAIIAWVSSLIAAGLDHVSIAVSASKVEALCDLKRRLINEGGVPEDRIGLVHSYKHDPAKITNGVPAEGYASEPCTTAERPILLVTHQRVRGGSLEAFNVYRGKPRDLLLYDESLIVSDAIGIPVNDLKGAIGWLSGKYGESDKHRELVAYVSECRNRIVAELTKLKDQPNGTERLLALPSVSPEKVTQFRELLGRREVVGVVHQLLDISDQRLRVITNGSGGVVWYQVSVPAEVKNIIILDASQPIRRLVHLDPSIKDAERHIDLVKNIGVPLSQLKRFDRVTLHQMFAGGGRATLTADFARDRAEDRKMVKEVVEVMKTIPPTEAVLIFTYKSRPSDRVDFRSTLLKDMDEAGIDTAAPFSFRDQTRQRLNVATWGMETSLNSFNHCSHVILAGVLQRSPVDLAASFLGQTDNLEADVSNAAVADLHRSEVCHAIYQALSRGTCRTVEDGLALPMTGYIIHRDDAIQAELSRVMPGAVWKVWKPKHPNVSTGDIKTLAHKMREHLDGLSPEVGRVSIRALKGAIGVHVPPRTWTHAVSHLPSLNCGWFLQDRSMVRASSIFAA